LQVETNFGKSGVATYKFVGADVALRFGILLLFGDDKMHTLNLHRLFTLQLFAVMLVSRSYASPDSKLHWFASTISSSKPISCPSGGFTSTTSRTEHVNRGVSLNVTSQTIFGPASASDFPQWMESMYECYCDRHHTSLTLLI